MIIPDRDPPSSKNYAPGWRPGKPWSLWDIMINYGFFGLAHLLRQFSEQETMLETKIWMGEAQKIKAMEENKQIMVDVISDEEKERMKGCLAYATNCASQLELQAAHDRIDRFIVAMRSTMSVPDYQSQIRTLREAFENGLQYQYFYRYPAERAKLLMLVPADWDSSIKAFPSIKDEIEAAIDLYAMGHNLACVFHLMRIAEIGVQRLGKKLGVSLTKLSANRLSDLTWHQILDAINPKLKALPQKTAVGRAKHEKYSAIQSYLYGVKDAWRNPTMHPRKSGYNDLETLNIINHVRSFMNELASIVSKS